MSTPTAIYFLAIVIIGLPTALRVTGFKVRVRNATALAMVGCWLFGRLVWWLTGEWLPVQAMVFQDMIVIATIFAKQDWCDLWPYRTVCAQFAALWLERSPWDRAILTLFLPTWLLYTPILPPTPQFWTLWGIGLAQLALAGHEAFHLWHRANGHSSRADARGPSPPLMCAPARERSYG